MIDYPENDRSEDKIALQPCSEIKQRILKITGIDVV
jgi:hypothetical protein